jgi:excinuclease UvrABC nuclease subunit
MHTCSRPCNNDIERRLYLEDIRQARLFIEGREEELEQSLVREMKDLAAQTKFEEAEILRRRLEKVQRARQEYKDIFFSVWSFDYLAVLASDSASRLKIAFIRQGRIIGFEKYELKSLAEDLARDLPRYFENLVESNASDSRYDEFCLVSQFVIDPLQSVTMLSVRGIEDLPTRVLECVQQRKRKRKPNHVDTVAG